MQPRDASRRETAADDLVETVVGAGYRPVASIGGGGMGMVYRAWDHTADRYVVLKVPRRELLVDPGFRARFDLEMQAARRMTHDGVVRVLDFGVHGDLPYAVLRYMAGGTLSARRPSQAGRPIPAASALLRHWLVAVADALDHVHARGYVHRDVKPANILFDGRGRPHLGDFGIAKAIRPAAPDGSRPSAPGLTVAGLAIGTPEYMAPEVVLGQPLDGRADQYSLAVVVFEFLTALLPITASTPSATMVAQATRSAPDPWTVRPELPASLRHALLRALAKDPAGRFASCREFVDVALTDVPEDPGDPQPRLTCPGCGSLVGVRPEMAGGGGTCPQCRATLRITPDLEAIVLPEETVPRPRRSPGGLPPAGGRAGTPSAPLVFVAWALAGLATLVVAWLVLRGYHR
mgnify:CR=1 FL=1